AGNEAGAVRSCARARVGRVRSLSGKEAFLRPRRAAGALPPRLPEPRARGRAALQHRARRPAEPARAARPPRAVREPAARVATGARLHPRRLPAPGAPGMAPRRRGGAALLRTAPRPGRGAAVLSGFRPLPALAEADRGLPRDVRP